MMTVMESNTHHVLQDTLPRIAKALERIATSLEKQELPDIKECAMGPGDDDEDIPF